MVYTSIVARVYTIHLKGAEMKAVLIGIVSLIVCTILLVAGLLTFGTSKPPKLLASVTNPFSAMDYSGLPPVQRYSARDGAKLSFRYYPAGEKQVAVLIHGSAGSSSDMHAMAQDLQRIGVTVFVPDLRGHGANLPHGDVSYVGQLDDDMADFLHFATPKYPSAMWTLIGFSSGGGWVLRIAAEPIGRSFDRYILLSPFLRYDAPTVQSTRKQDQSENRGVSSASQNVATSQVWAGVNTGRIVGLILLNKLGIHMFDGLPVLTFAVPPNIPSLTASYSWRLQQSFQPHDDYLSDIRLVSKPMQVFVGSADELFLPSKFREVFGSQRNDIQVTVLPGLGHSDMVTNPIAIQAIAATFPQ